MYPRKFIKSFLKMDKRTRQISTHSQLRPRRRKELSIQDKSFFHQTQLPSVSLSGTQQRGVKEKRTSSRNEERTCARERKRSPTSSDPAKAKRSKEPPNKGEFAKKKNEPETPERRRESACTRPLGNAASVQPPECARETKDVRTYVRCPAVLRG